MRSECGHRGQSEALEHRVRLVSANFKLALARKDLRLVTDAAERRGREMKVATAAKDWFDRATDAGAGEEDYSAVVATILNG